MALTYPGGYITKSPPTPTSTSAPGIWTLEQAMQYIKAGTWPIPPVGDPYWQYTTLLSGTGSTNGAQNNTFLDSSTNNFTITRNGNTSQGTFTPFSVPNGYWGVFFDGTDDYLYPPANTAFNVGTGDFCVETFAYLTDNINVGIFQIEDAPLSSTFTGLLFWAQSNGYWQGRIGTTNFLGTSATPALLNTWLHLAVTRSSGTLRVFQNGIQIYSGTHTDNLSSKDVLTIGGIYASSYCMQGHLSNFRFVKGSAVYTSNFTPSTTPLTEISGTSVLTCQSNRFLDNSANAFTITAFDGPRVISFAPFGNENLYSTTSVGGSAYFDADADRLETSSTSSDFQFTGDFTIEGWFYPNGTALDSQPFGQNYSGGGVQLYVNANGSIEVAYGVASQFTTSAGAVVKGQWNHIALTRSGTTVRCMVNGVSVGNKTTSGTIGATTAFAIGARSGGGYVCDGYISSVRIVNGTAVYTGSTYTIPTAPVTAITNTKLLCNFTNAGIFDKAAANDFETVGNAQVSTSVVKYGSGSMYFDGVGDRLYRVNSPLYNFGAGDFTVECWVYIAANTSYATLIDFSADGGGGYGWFLEYSSTRGVLFYMGTGGGNSNITANLTPALTTWTHIAVTRSNGYAKIFINGGQVVGASLTSSSVSTEPLVIGSSKNGTYPLNGYLSDVRITKGLARYTYNFTPPTQAFGTFFQAQTTPTADPYFDYTTLLLPGNGTNGAQNNTFLDSSTNAFTITRNGNTTQGTFTPFSQTGWSNYFDGSGDYLTIPNNTALQFGSGDFTIEAWIYPTVLAFGDVFSKGDYGGGATAGYFEFRKTDTNAMSFYSNNTGTALTTSSTMQLSNWSHVAVSRSGTTVRIFINGVLCASGTDSTTYSNTGLSAIGAASQTSYTNFFDGYISNLRVVKGTAVYTTNFTPSTTALTAISGTSLLTCQNNRFIDNSTNAFTLTANGNVAVQAYSPFAPTSAYSAATVGGSGYFDGSGDALLLADSSQFTLGTNNFTVEAWVYPTTTGVQRIISGQSNSGASGSTISYWLDINSSNQPRILIWSGATDYTATSSVAVSSNQWVHIAGVRNGNTLSIYVNGVSTGTVSVTGVTVNDSSNQLAIGQLGEHTNVPWSGYISSFRLVNGTAVYTSTFTPPSAPLTAITNTSLLTNFTNAGIIDSTAQNDLETVGNAQISNTIAKWGSTSMYFDGSGDSLSLPNSFNFRKGDWTIECWIYFNTSTISKTWFVQNNGTQFYTSNTGKLRIDTKVSGGDKRITGTTDLVTGQWYHVAATRYGATQMLFLNGQLEGTFDLGTSSLDVRTDPTSIGSVFEGYIQDMRVTTGIARYTQNFTPPTAAFQLL